MNFPWPSYNYNSCHHHPSDDSDSTSSWARAWSFNMGNTGLHSSPYSCAEDNPRARAVPPPPYSRFDNVASGYGYGYGPNWLNAFNRSWIPSYWWYSPVAPPPPPAYPQGSGGSGSVYGGFDINSFDSVPGGGSGPNSQSADGPNKDFEVRIDVSNYKPEELSVKTVDSTKIIVEGHKESHGPHTATSRSFEKRYKLPVGIPPENLQARITEDGKQLILSAQKPRPAKAPATENAAEAESNPNERPNPNEKNVNIEKPQPQSESAQRPHQD